MKVEKYLKYVAIAVAVVAILAVIALLGEGGFLLLWIIFTILFFTCFSLNGLFEKKKEKMTVKRKELFEQLQKQYPYSFEKSELIEYKSRKKLKPYYLIRTELTAIQEKGIGGNWSGLDFCSPYSFRVYMGNNDKGKYKDLFNVIFSQYTIAVDYFVRNEYNSNKYLNGDEKKELNVNNYLSNDEVIVYEELNGSYKGNLDSLSFEQKLFLATHVSIFIKLYTKYVQLAQNRKTVDALYHQCPRSFDYYCKKLIQKTTKNQCGYENIESPFLLSSEEVSLLANKKEECEQLEQDWDRIDYDKAMNSTSNDSSMQSIGKQMEDDLEKERIRKWLESSKSDEMSNYSSFSLSEALSETVNLIKKKESEEKDEERKDFVRALRNTNFESKKNTDQVKKEEQEAKPEIKEETRIENGPKRKLSRPLNSNTKRIALLVAKQQEVTERWIRYNGHLSIYDATEVYLQLTELGILSRLRHSETRVFKKVICHDIDVINRIIDENSNLT